MVLQLNHTHLIMTYPRGSFICNHREAPGSKTCLLIFKIGS